MKKKIILTMSILTIVFGLAIMKNPKEVEASSTTTGYATANLNLRKGGSTKYKRIGLIKKNNKVTIISKKNGWYKVKYGSKTGWCYGKYISTSSKTSTKTSTSSVKKTLKVKAYAYSGEGLTAIGTKCRYGVIAADPRVLPYGTKVYIKELGRTFTVEDCGGGIKGNKIDIYMNSAQACRKWGVRTITIQILK